MAEAQGVDVGEELLEIGKIVEGIEERMQVLADALDAAHYTHSKSKAL